MEGASREIREKLREKMGAISKLAPPEGWRLPGLTDEVRRGCLIELLGDDTQEWLVEVFKLHPETRLAWVSPHLEIFPTALVQRGVNLSRCLFLQPKQEISWSLMQVLRSGLFAFVMVPIAAIPERQTDVFLRKLQLLAERSYSNVFFLSQAATPSFGFSYRIEVNRVRSPDALPFLEGGDLSGSSSAQPPLREVKILKGPRGGATAAVQETAQAISWRT